MCVFTAGGALYRVKSINSGGIAVTGSSQKDFVSDLIVWRGYFSQTAPTQKQAYDLLKKDQDGIKQYLSDNEVNENEIVFSAIRINQNWVEEKTIDEYGQPVYRSVSNGYTLTQDLTITSNEVDKIEGISRDITQLIDLGISFMSDAPEYYYTKLSELKIQMISEATENAKIRATEIANNAGSSLGELKDASLGVFQITAQNSTDEYNSYGTLNTSAKFKTAQITVRLNYKIGGKQ